MQASLLALLANCQISGKILDKTESYVTPNLGLQPAELGRPGSEGQGLSVAEPWISASTFSSQYVMPMSRYIVVRW
jgi:hypothetical protein